MTRTTRRTVLRTLGALGAGATTAGAQSTESTASTTQPVTDAALPPTAELESFVDEVMTARIGDATPGLTVAIVDGDDVALAKGYGRADAASGDPVRADETTFQIGSVSKLVTWTAVMQGIEAGRLALDADVIGYLADSAVEIPDTYDDPVTLGDLGTHTAGFESMVPRFVDDPAALTSIETALVENRPDRVRPPGTAVEYSNYGTTLAGHVVAEGHDTTFEEYVQTEILEPLGMTHSTFAQPVPADHPGTPAAPHIRKDGEFVAVDRGYVNARPAGSMTATATDMAAFMSAHLGDGALGDARILDAATVRDMHSQHYVRHPAVNNWRYGFYEYGPVDAGAIAHSGGTPHFVTELVLVPAHDVGVFVSYNTATTNVLAADVDRILREYDLLPDAETPAPTTGTGRRRRAETVAGEYSRTMTYDSGPGRVLGLVGRVGVEAAGDGRLVSSTLSSRFGKGKRTWVETDPYVFHEVGGSDVLAFDVTDGTVETMHMSSLPQTAFEPVPVHDEQLVTGGVVGGALSGFTLSLLGWGGAVAWRQKRRLASTATDADRPAVDPRADDGEEVTR